ncbi:hypothetical protein LEP1GSC082_0605 [Leptospira kirschneri str. H2]|nr:hypothetical protein LEP1GSC082_0605 [Leptospira kirschneri str. H2]
MKSLHSFPLMMIIEPPFCDCDFVFICKDWVVSNVPISLQNRFLILASSISLNTTIR